MGHREPRRQVRRNAAQVVLRGLFRAAVVVAAVGAANATTPRGLATHGEQPGQSTVAMEHRLASLKTVSLERNDTLWMWKEVRKLMLHG